jgi:cell division protein FtsX
MKHRTIVITLVLFVLSFLMIWSLGSSAANSNERPAANSLPDNDTQSIEAQQGAEKDADADMGKWGASGISREEYIRARD